MKLLKTLAAVAAAVLFSLAANAARIEDAALGVSYTVPDGSAYDPESGLYFDASHMFGVVEVTDATYEDMVADAVNTTQMLNGLPMSEDMSIEFSYEETGFGDFAGLYSELYMVQYGETVASYTFNFEYGGKLIAAEMQCDERDAAAMEAFFTSLTILAEGAETPASVEISFKVGESTLLINGKEVTVETPYTVGDGVTLVPVRVITEAFGAKVGWDEETETVTVDYPDVSVSLQIGSTAAEVNGRFTTLPAAPELSEAGFTMVPLRFLSETFGAEVSYDEATEAILVTLETEQSGDIFTLDRGVKEKYIGSVKNGWALETLNGLTFYDGSLVSADGVVLIDNSGTMFIIASKPLEDDYDFDEDYDNVIDIAKETARFIKREKNTTDYDYDYFDVQVLKKSTYGERLTVTRCYTFDDHLVLVLAEVNMKSEGAKDSALAVLDSITFDVDPENTYDIGSSEFTFKDYTFDEIGISFRAPEEFAPAIEGETYSDSRSNRIYGVKANEGYVIANFYSASDVGDAGILLENERQAELYGADKTLFASTPVEKTTFLGHEAYAYELKCLTLGGVTLVGRQYAVTVGSYTYIISSVAKDIKTVDEILNSFEITELDADKEGFLFCTEDRRDDLGSTFGAECGDYTLTVPGVFECDEEASDRNSSYYHLISLNGTNINEMVEFSFSQLDKGYYGMPLFTGMTAREAAQSVFDSYFHEETDEIVSPLSPVELGGRMWYAVTITYKGASDNIRYYDTCYYCLDDGTFLEVDFSWNELYDTPETKALGEQIVSSVKKTK